MKISLLRRTALALLILGATLLFGSGAGAQENPDYTAPAPAEVVTTPIQTARSTTATPSSAASANQLPLTGTDAVQLLVVGGVLIGGGAALLATRRRTTA